MENILSQFSADNLEIKLTSEKLFINTAVSSEAFALRSVNGIGVVDLVDDYNKALTEWKAKRGLQNFGLFGGVVCGILGLITMLLGGVGTGFGVVTVGVVTTIIIRRLNKTNSEPKLMSAVRVMMSGGNRDFQFDKAGIQSGNIAEFVAKVESTLTAYHNNNN